MDELFLTMGLMLAPTALVAVGNGAGLAGGWLFLCFLAVAFVVAFYTSGSYGRLADVQRGAFCEERGIGRAFGNLITLVPFVGRVTLLLSLGSGLLIISGYVFNETFAFGYPNLALSLTLLGLIFILLQLPERLYLAVQKIAALAALLGLATIIAAAFFAGASGPGAPRSLEGLGRAGHLAFFALLGFDLAMFHPSDAMRQTSRTGIVRLGLMIASLLFAALAPAYLCAVPGQTLAESTIPHFAMGRAALGETGRIIMAVVAVAGSLSALLALLHATSRQAISVFRGQVRRYAKPSGTSRRASTLILCAGLAAVLASGLGGEPLLQDLLAASVALWLCGYAVVNLTALTLVRQRSLHGFPALRSVVPMAFNLAAAAGAGLVAVDFIRFAWMFGALLAAAVLLGLLFGESH